MMSSTSFDNSPYSELSEMEFLTMQNRVLEHQNEELKKRNKEMAGIIEKGKVCCKEVK